MKVDLSTELANLITVTGGLVACINAHAGELEDKDPIAKDVLGYHVRIPLHYGKA